MLKLDRVWVLAEDLVLLKELCAGANELGKQVEAIVIGNEVTAEQVSSFGVTNVYYFKDFNPNETACIYFPSIISLIKAEKPGLVLLDTSKNGRLLAGNLAAALGTSTLTDVLEIAVQDEKAIQTTRMVYGGTAFHKERSKSEVKIACVGVGVFEATNASNSSGEMTEIDFVAPLNKIKLIERKAKEEQSVNLVAAKRVIAVGRGFTAKEQLEYAFDLAKAIQAEVGCTRPIAEEEKWMDKSRYIGISGKMLKADIYFGFGVSGQIQHTVGVNNSRIIVAVNKDKNAPIFQQADYGIVGEIEKVLPGLITLFGS